MTAHTSKENIGIDITDPAFWTRPLGARMADFARLRAADPFARFDFENPLTGLVEEFYAVTRYADVQEISRRPRQFCSGQGATSIVDMPMEAMEFFGSFINMDDPRHARQRGIVARAFTPRRLAEVLDSVEAVCVSLIEDIAGQGEADLVAALSVPFPLRVICDMMGIPPASFATVLDATNVILSGGDAEFVGDREPLGAFLEAGMTLSALMAELAEERRRQPTGDLTSALVNADVGEDALSPADLSSFFILLAVAGNDTTRTAISLGMTLLSENPDERRLLQSDLDGLLPGAVEEIVRCASPVTFMRRTATEGCSVGGRPFSAGDRLILFYGAANRDPDVFADPDRFDVRRDPNPHVGFGGPGPHFCLGAHLARRELAVALRQLLTRLPDIELAGPPEPLNPINIPLVGGIKRVPVRFSPVGRRRPQGAPAT